MERDRSAVADVFEQLEIISAADVAFSETDPPTIAPGVLDIDDFYVRLERLKMLAPAIPVHDEGVPDVEGDAYFCRVESLDDLSHLPQVSSQVSAPRR